MGWRYTARSGDKLHQDVYEQKPIKDVLQDIIDVWNEIYTLTHDQEALETAQDLEARKSKIKSTTAVDHQLEKLYDYGDAYRIWLGC